MHLSQESDCARVDKTRRQKRYLNMQTSTLEVNRILSTTPGMRYWMEPSAVVFETRLHTIKSLTMRSSRSSHIIPARKESNRKNRSLSPSLNSCDGYFRATARCIE